ncbi:MAG TPA: AAA family ATPase, partial [Terriglobales bacterium]|nr:AAA family ATPase [Terriglobales bacterium]
MRTLAVVNMKGGVGKTTTAVHLAAGFARRGLRTLLVDADPQGNVAHALGLAPGVTLRELMLGEAPLEAVIHAAVRPRLDVIASTTAAFGLEPHLAGQVQRETVLTRRLRALAGYDAVVFDTSPAMSLLTLNVLVCAAEVVVPVGMDSLALVGARQTLTGLAEIRELWPERGLRLAAVLPTAVKPAT